MRTSIRLAALALIAAAPIAAQGPGAPGGMAQAPAGAPGVRFLLAHTGELNLTDAQVTRLAAIARRGEARRQAARAAHDSMRTRMMAQGMPTDTAAMNARHRAKMTTMQSSRQTLADQARTDLRDGIAVLNADQQARAWELLARAGAQRRMLRPGRGARPGRGMGVGMGGPRRGMPGMSGMRDPGMGMGPGPGGPPIE